MTTRDERLAALKKAKYLGDGAWVEYDGYNVVLFTTYGGDKRTNTVCLEPSVMACFEAWMRTAKAQLVEIAKLDAELVR